MGFIARAIEGAYRRWWVNPRTEREVRDRLAAQILLHLADPLFRSYRVDVSSYTTSNGVTGYVNVTFDYAADPTEEQAMSDAVQILKRLMPRGYRLRVYAGAKRLYPPPWEPPGSGDPP